MLGENAGLILTGIVVGREPEDRLFPKTDYSPAQWSRTFSVADGERSFKFSLKEESQANLPEIPLFASIRVRVDYCKADKGNISVGGSIIR